MSKSYVKVVGLEEVVFTTFASSIGVGPKILCCVNIDPSFRDGPDKFQLSTLLYPTTLSKIKEPWETYRDSIVECLKTLHQAGVAHMDVSEENIVINPKTREVRLIDFGISQWIKDLTGIEDNYNYDEAKGPCSSVEELLSREIAEVDFLCFTKKINLVYEYGS